jgi:hypothetical protein
MKADGARGARTMLGDDGNQIGAHSALRNLHSALNRLFSCIHFVMDVGQLAFESQRNFWLKTGMTIIIGLNIVILTQLHTRLFTPYLTNSHL